MSTEVTDTGYLYQLILRGECGRLVAGLFDDVMIEPAENQTSMIFCVQDDSELRGLLDRIQNLELHLITLNEIGSIGTVPPGNRRLRACSS
jgi:hypothetical protein